MHTQHDILVIDDEQVVLDAIQRICSSEGFSVDCALDAKTANEKMRKITYRLVICDIMLPQTSGFEILEQHSGLRPRTCFIMTTGFSTVENAVSSLLRGAVDFIPKPFTNDELLSAVRRGFRYRELPHDSPTAGTQKKQISLAYVPCPAGYHRLGQLSWVVLETAGSGLVGVTDLFLKTAHSVEGVELVEPGQETIQGASCAKIFSADGLAHQVLAPLSGSVIERNEGLVTDQSILEKDPYFKGWMYRIIPTALEYELKQLSSSDAEPLLGLQVH